MDLHLFHLPAEERSQVATMRPRPEFSANFDRCSISSVTFKIFSKYRHDDFVNSWFSSTNLFLGLSLGFSPDSRFGYPKLSPKRKKQSKNKDGGKNGSEKKPKRG